MAALNILTSTIIFSSLILMAAHLSYGEDVECLPKDFGHGSVVCVCNASYCDTLRPLQKLDPGQYWTVTSTKDGQRFQRQQNDFLEKGFADEAVILSLMLNHEKTNQTIMGFGGSFTDASAINIMNLTEAARDNLLRAYFSSDGIEYTFGRVPIGGTDFSPRLYSYDDGQAGDFHLDHFSLSVEDLDYKIPVIQRAMAVSTRLIKLFGSPWSAPAWMKTNENLVGEGCLKGDVGGQYYQTWADYYVKFLQGYSEHNLSFWGVTAQNEPLDGNIADFAFNCMGFTAESQRIFIGENLGPTLEGDGFGDVSILMLDDQRLLLPQWAQEVLRNDSVTKDYVAGIAFHWYLNFVLPSEVLTQTHDLFPNKFLLSTEASEGAQPFEAKVALGQWNRAEHYALDIIDDLLHWTAGWVDWNICLNEVGGPNWLGGAVDSPVIVNAEMDEFYKQPMFYVLGHFSKFVPPGSVVIEVGSSSIDSDIAFIGFDVPDGSTAVILISTSEIAKHVRIQDPNAGTITAELPPRSIQTYIWWC